MSIQKLCKLNDFQMHDMTRIQYCLHKIPDSDAAVNHRLKSPGQF